MNRKISVLLGTGALLAAGLSVLSAPAAQADELGCPDRAVCFFKNVTSRTGVYQDVTSSWQTLSASRGATTVWNTRHDDGALLHFTNGATRCIRPGVLNENLASIGTVDKIRIMTSPSC
ncbi:hypothetical protein [Streptomyces turgidiscabies]|uniref:Kynureninase n=2 Tax=Streptomyces TaxID=1883 RepID=A0ABU0RRQ4_9ACTN|nr:hypothetical protein [Streptomyces turgidiscabies]MDQ0934672.1 kynureninase [Streptomyces turgidiscabies]